jgi:hypothetical protein
MLRHRLSWLLTAAAIAAFDGSASAQVVAGWSHETAGGVEFAYYTKGLAELTVRCKGSAVEVVYYVDAAAIDPALKGRINAVFAVLLDDAPDVLWINSSLISEPGVVSIGIGGKDADELARQLATASRSILVSILTGPPQPTSPQYNTAQFPIYGAADAIKAAYAGCGLKY